MSKRKPEANKQINAALRKFRRLLEKKLGRDLYTNEDIEFSLCVEFSKRNEELDIDEAVRAAAKESGFSDFFELAGSGTDFTSRDITFVLK